LTKDRLSEEINIFPHRWIIGGIIKQRYEKSLNNRGFFYRTLLIYYYKNGLNGVYECI